MNEPFKPIQIKVDDSKSRGTKKPASKSRPSSGPSKSEFDPAALSRLIGGGTPAAETPVVSADPAPDPPADSTSQVPESPAASESPSPVEEAPATVEEPILLPAEETPADQGLASAPSPAGTATPGIVVIQTDPSSSTKSEKRKPAAAKKTPPAPAAAPAAKHRGAKRGAKPKAVVGGSAAKRFPTAWVVVGVSGGSVLGLMILLFSLLGGTSGDAPTGANPSGGRSAAAPVSAPRSLPTFQSEIPIGTGGVRPMDAAEQARRRERIASFAEMAREQEAELEKEKTPPQP